MQATLSPRDIRGMILRLVDGRLPTVQVSTTDGEETLAILKTISWIYRSQPKVRHLSQLSTDDRTVPDHGVYAGHLLGR